MGIFFTRKALIAAGAGALIMAPTAAFAATSIGYSSGQGVGTGSISWTGTKNFNYNVNVCSVNGNNVYTQYKGVRDNFPDTNGIRMHGDTSACSQHFVGSVSGSTGSLAWSGAAFKICQDKSFEPDSCGSYSTTYRRP
jgi:hypothetical protein